MIEYKSFSCKYCLFNSSYELIFSEEMTKDCGWNKGWKSVKTILFYNIDRVKLHALKLLVFHMDTPYQSFLIPSYERSIGFGKRSQSENFRLSHGSWPLNNEKICDAFPSACLFVGRSVGMSVCLQFCWRYSVHTQ